MQSLSAIWLRCPPTRGSAAAHEYTLSNLRFAQAVEPDNQDIAHYLSALSEQLREAGRAHACPRN